MKISLWLFNLLVVAYGNLTAISNLTMELADRRRSILPKIDRILGHLMKFPGLLVAMIP
jgi:hypothetical protein